MFDSREKELRFPLFQTRILTPFSPFCIYFSFDIPAIQTGPQVARLGNTGCSIMDKDVNMQKLYAIRTVQV